MKVHSQLDAVTLYREGAVCSRHAQLESPAPSGTQVQIVGLPLSLTPGSLRAKLTGTEARVLDVRAAFDVVLTDALDLPTESKAVFAAQATYEALFSDLTAMENEIHELQSLQPKPLEPKRGSPPREAAVEATLALADFVEGRLVTRLAARRALEKRVADALEALTLARQRLHEASAAVRSERAQVSRAAVVTLSEPIAANTKAVLTLEYVVPGARWVPNYQLRLARGFSGGTLMMRASVAQSTGEDWAGVSLSLSTASLQRRADLPELKSLRIGRAQPPPPRSGWREPPQGLEALFEAADANQGLAPSSNAGLASSASSGAVSPVLGSGMMQAQSRGASEKAKGAKKPSATMAFAGGAPPLPAPSAAPPRSAPKSIAMRRSRLEKKASVSDDDLASSAFEEVAHSSPDDEYPMADLADGGEGAPEPEASFVDDGPGSSAAAKLGSQLRDYDTLSMPDAITGPQRGRLQPMLNPDFAFGASLSIEIDLVIQLVIAAHTKATEVTYLPLPPGCTPVQSFDHFDYRFDCQGRLEVPSVGKWVTVPVMTCQVGLTPKYVCVPSVEPKVYRTLAIDNATAHALLAGPVDVSAGDEFLMTTELPSMGPGATSERLGLGVEESIKVARKTKYTETSGGFLGGSALLPHDVSIEVNNRLSTPAIVEVRERVPWPDPSEKDIKVEEAQITPPWERVEKALDGVITNGARRWLVTVPPGQTTTLTAQFTIRIPADRMLVGGNRRS